MAGENQFIRGAGMLAVLKVLEGGELYGYAIVEALAKTKGEALHLGQATVYPMLYNLEAKGLVKARWDESGPRSRKYYSLTKAGKTRLAEDADEWSAITRAMASLGLERTALLRLATGALAACAAWLAPASVAPISTATAAAVPPSSAATSADAYARLAERLREIERRDMESVAAQDSRHAYVMSGVADETTQRWLEAVRPFARELVDAASLPPGPALDYGAGYELPLPHLADRRFLHRTLRVLAHDAAVRGDRALVGDLLRTQVIGIRQVGEDRVLVSTLVSAAMTAMNIATVDDLISRGAIDRSGAKAVLEARSGLAAELQAQRLASFEMEANMTVQEAGKLATLGPAERMARLATFGVPQAGGIESMPAEQLTEQAESYRSALREALANPEPAALKAALAALEARASDGEFGAFVQALAPDMLGTMARLEALLPTLAAQDKLLADLASGAKSTEDLENAAFHYVAAGHAVRSLSAAMQREAELARLAPEGMTAQQRIDVRRAVELLRAHVIDRVMRATRLKRCVFESPHGLLSSTDPYLVNAESLGLLGALRIALFDPILPGERPEGSAGALDACVAALVAVRHLAEGGGIIHALVAQQLARDVADVLGELAAKERLDAAAHERLSAELARMNPSDPFGLRRATDFERARIAGMRQIPNASQRKDTPFDLERLRNLSPDAIAFLVGVLTAASPAVAPEPCECPFDGPLLEVRGFFDLAALKAAQAQADAFRESFDAAVRDGTDPDGSALRSLTVTKPVDMQARLNESVADFERLHRFGTPAAITPAQEGSR